MVDKIENDIVDLKTKEQLKNVFNELILTDVSNKIENCKNEVISQQKNVIAKISDQKNEAIFLENKLDNILKSLQFVADDIKNVDIDIVNENIKRLSEYIIPVYKTFCSRDDRERLKDKIEKTLDLFDEIRELLNDNYIRTFDDMKMLHNNLMEQDTRLKELSDSVINYHNDIIKMEDEITNKVNLLGSKIKNIFLFGSIIQAVIIIATIIICSTWS